MQQDSTNQVPSEDNSQNDRDRNFRALEAKYQRQLEQERAARIEAERIAQEAQRRPQEIDDDDNSDPYVDHRKLQKNLKRHGEEIKQQTQSEIQRAVQQAREEAKQEAFLDAHGDFYDTIEKNAKKLLDKSPALTKSILAMPDNFERQKLVYQTIKEMGLDKPPQKEASIQDTIDKNRQNPYYQPSNIGNPGHQTQGDFSPNGRKAAYEKMQELKSRLSL